MCQLRHANTHTLHMQTQRHTKTTKTQSFFKTHTQGQQNHINNETLMKIHERLKISLQKPIWQIS